MRRKMSLDEAASLWSQGPQAAFAGRQYGGGRENGFRA